MDNKNGQKHDPRRDDRGHWLPGLSGNPAGRPKREVEQEAYQTVLASCPLEELAAVVKALVLRAKEGDVPAARLLLEYIVGKPTETVAISSETPEEVTLFLPRFGTGGNGNGGESAQERSELADES